MPSEWKLSWHVSNSVLVLAYIISLKSFKSFCLWSFLTPLSLLHSHHQLACNMCHWHCKVLAFGHAFLRALTSAWKYWSYINYVNKILSKLWQEPIHINVGLIICKVRFEFLIIIIIQKADLILNEENIL